MGGDVAAETVAEEMLRFDSALQLFERTAKADVEVAGQTVAAGEKIAVLLGSANRDESVFERADQMDVGRDPNPHLAFGAGLHFCLGAPLGAGRAGRIAAGADVGVPRPGAGGGADETTDVRAAGL